MLDLYPSLDPTLCLGGGGDYHVSSDQMRTRRAKTDLATLMKEALAHFGQEDWEQINVHYQHFTWLQ